MPQAAKSFQYHFTAIGQSGSSKAAAMLLNSRAWRKASKTFLSTNLFCIECEKRGKTVFATQTDHIKPHRANLEVFWDESNWQPLCSSCGGAKSGRGE